MSLNHLTGKFFWGHCITDNMLKMEVLKCWDLTWLAPCPTQTMLNFTNNGWMDENRFFFWTQHCLKKGGGGRWRMKYHCQYFAKVFQIQSTLRENSASRISLLPCSMKILWIGDFLWFAGTNFWGSRWLKFLVGTNFCDSLFK